MCYCSPSLPRVMLQTNQILKAYVRSTSTKRSQFCTSIFCFICLSQKKSICFESFFIFWLITSVCVCVPVPPGRVVIDSVQLTWAWWGDLSFQPCYQRELVKQDCLISSGMAIREESETSVVTDTDQWSSGSLCTQQQRTFTHLGMHIHTHACTYTLKKCAS